jgi:hypothetical protein
LPVFDVEQMDGVRQDVRQAVLQFPEFKRAPGEPECNSAGHKLLYSLGGFAALANPASFHAPVIRKLRSACLVAAIRTAFREALTDSPEIKVEVLFDRLMIRQALQKPASEAWHRDLTPQHIRKLGDSFYGGWLNLDDTPQYFSHVPGTHEAPRSAREVKGVKFTGFHMCTEDDKKDFAVKKKRLEVPPGHLLIFSQDLIHEIVAEARPAESTRLFIGFRLTTSDAPLFDHQHTIDDQVCVRVCLTFF